MKPETAEFANTFYPIRLDDRTVITASTTRPITPPPILSFLESGQVRCPSPNIASF
jgi:hypothetical protein